MAQKLGSLFFSTAKNLMRLQRSAFRLNKPLPIPRKKKATKTIAKKVLAKQPPGLGTGVWRRNTYKRDPSNTELLGELNFFTYIPVMRPVVGMPLVVMLHGCQQTALDFAQGAGMNQLADQKGFVVLYPQQAKRVNNHRCWRWFEPRDGYGLSEADDIAGLIRATVVRHKLDRRRVYIAGLSAGAGMAGLVAVRHPALIAALGMHSGPVLGDAQSGGAALLTMRRGTVKHPVELMAPLLEGAAAKFPGMPTIILQGQKDNVVSATNAQQLMQQFTYLNDLPEGLSPESTKAGAKQTAPAVLGKGTTRQYKRVDVVMGSKTMVRMCTIEKLDHAWSGGNAAIKFHSGTGPKASLLMWQFFNKHANS